MIHGKMAGADPDAKFKRQWGSLTPQEQLVYEQTTSDIDHERLDEEVDRKVAMLAGQQRWLRSHGKA